MNDGFTTEDIFFAVALMYVFGDEALTRIELAERDPSPKRRQGKRFILDIPSLDAEEYSKEFKAGKFAISDLLSYIRSYNGVTRILKDMTRRGEPEWASPSYSERWIRGEVK